MKILKGLLSCLLIATLGLSATACGGNDAASTGNDGSSNSVSDSSSFLPSETVEYTVAVLGGTITGTDKTSGTFEKNSSVSVTAAPPEGKGFVCWKAGGETVSTENPYTFIVTKNVSLSAEFKDIPYYGLSEEERKDLTNDKDAVASAAGFSSAGTQNEMKNGGDQSFKATIAAEKNDDWPHVTFDAEKYFNEKADLTKTPCLEFDIKIVNGKNWFSYWVYTDGETKTPEDGYDIGLTKAGVECKEDGEWLHIVMDFEVLQPQATRLSKIEFCFTNEGSDKKSESVFYLDNMHFAEVDPAKIAARYEAKDMSNQENAEVGDGACMATSLSKEVYSEHSNASRLVKVNADAPENGYIVRILANAYFKDWGCWNASEAKLSFDVKVSNVKRIGFYLDPDNGKPSKTIYFNLTDGEHGDGYTVVALADGWFRVEMDFARCDFSNSDFALTMVKKFVFEMDIRGTDLTKEHTLYLDNIILEGGKDITA